MSVTNQTLRMATLAFIVLMTALSTLASEGIAAFDNGQFETARNALTQEIVADEDNATLHLYLGRSLMALNDARAAVKPLGRAAELAPTNPDAHFHLGEANGVLASNANILSAGRYAKVVRSSFERALELDPNHEPALEGLILYKLRAPRLLGGDKEGALALCERLGKIAPLRGQIVRANTLRAMDRDDEATTLLSALADDNPHDPRVHVELGFMAQNEKEYAQAFEHFQRAGAGVAESEPQAYARHMAWYQLGRNAVFSGLNEEEGIEGLTRYLEAAPQDADLPGNDWASFRLGELLQKRGESDKATTYFQTALNSTNDKNLKRKAKKALR